MSNPTRSILVERRGGEDMIIEDIPGDAKVTFGALHPGSKDGRGYGEGDKVLRVYQGSAAGGNQLAVVTNVVAFRDLSLKVKQKKIVRKSDSKVETGPDGNRRKAGSEISYEWADVNDA